MRYGAPGVKFNAFRMHQFKCFTSNINSLSNPVFVSTGTNGLPNGLPFKNLLVMERTFVLLDVIFFYIKPLPEDFLTVKETVKDYVPVDTESVIHKL